MNRRALLKTGGAAMLGVGLGGCRPARAPQVTPTAPVRPRVNLAVPRIAPERVIRTTVGLRPHRDRRLRPSRRQAQRQDPHPQLRSRRRRHVAVVGLRHDRRRSGAAGRDQAGGGHRLRVARPVDGAATAASRIRGDDLRHHRAARHHVQHVAGGLHADHGTRPATSAARRRGTRNSCTAAEMSYRQLQLMAGPRYGVYWIDSYNATDDPNPQPGGGGSTETSSPSICGRAAAATCWAPASIRSRRVRGAHVEPGDRAVDLPRCARPGLPPVRRPDRDPQVRHAARSGVAVRSGHRELHRSRVVLALRRQGARADQGPAHPRGAAARSELPRLRAHARRRQHA